MSGLQFNFHFFFDFLFHPQHALVMGLCITVYSAVIAQLLGTILGTLLALAGMSRFRVIRFLRGVYVWFFRGTPILVQLVLVYFGSPYLLRTDLFPLTIHVLGLRISGAILAGIIALTLNEAAYMSEIVRGGISAVDPGQLEAGKSLGLTHGRVMRHVVLPQTVRIVLPPFGNQFNGMLKMTSLMSYIAVPELFYISNNIQASTFRSFEVYFGLALYYLLLTTVWTGIQTLIERRVNRSVTMAAPTPSVFQRLTGTRLSANLTEMPPLS